MGKIIGNTNHAASLTFSPLGHKKGKPSGKPKPLGKAPVGGNNVGGKA